MIRRMNRDDVESIHQLETECFSRPWSVASIEKEVDNDKSLFCVCEIEGNVVGYAGMYYICEEGDITNVAVKEEYRNRGIGRELLTEMFHLAYLDGIREFTLEVRESNLMARHLYESMGFKTEGLRKNFYDNPLENGIIMWKRQ